MTGDDVAGGPRVGLLAARIRAEERDILTALRRRGIEAAPVDAAALYFPIDGVPAPWSLVLNREISLTRAVYAARCLEAWGILVVNTAATAATCGDKWLTSLALDERSLPTARTALALTPAAALAALDEIGYPAVIKPLVGSWGRLVSLLPDRATAVTVLDYVAALPAPLARLVYVQQFIADAKRDLRVVVVGDQALGVTWRQAQGWRANVATGATSVRCALTSDVAELSVAAAEAVGAEIAGVDLIEDAAGELRIIEVNHRVEFAGFQAAHADRVNVAECIADHLMRQVGA
ncbi:RimK family alpha-L-glutamate ligase [Plantactinospora sp. B6F1]|uniref:RimK family alpha-L-glutamate ligase n=1 Tax=Plantactinospora sp. B6F1 TaxID=3158971 RepID=UPI0010D4D84D